MADIFVSYSRVDRRAVAPIVGLLDTQGWSVWWDTALRAGEQWDEAIEREIRAARCVLVVWSKVSVTRRWVRAEANFGLGRDNLVPVVIDDAEPPLAFSLVQTADLRTWSGDAAAAEAQRVIEDVRDKMAVVLTISNTFSPATISLPVAPASTQALHDWGLIEASSDARDYRAFIEVHPDGFLARRAHHRLEDLADLDWLRVRASREAIELQRFIRFYFDCKHAEAAAALLASLETEVSPKHLQVAEVRVPEAIKAPEQVSVEPETASDAAIASALELKRQAIQEDHQSASNTFEEIRVYFGTHRKPRGRRNPYEAFSAERDTRMHFGSANITLPRHRSAGSIPLPARSEPSSDPGKYVVISDWNLQRNSELTESLQRTILASNNKELLVFVHGYRSSFPRALMQAAQLATDLDIDGATVAYSWPSRDGLLSYFADRGPIIASHTRDLKELIKQAALNSGAQKMYLIAHSLGAEHLLYALELLIQDGINSEVFAEIFFYLPDVDGDEFNVRVSSIKQLAARITIYTSGNDKALGVSRFLLGSSRAGQSAHIKSLPNIDHIDLGPIGESWVTDNTLSKAAIDDLRAVIWADASPSHRLLQEMRDADRRSWQIPSRDVAELAEGPYRRALLLIRSLGKEGAKTRVSRVLSSDNSRDPGSFNDVTYWQDVLKYINLMGSD